MCAGPALLAPCGFPKIVLYLPLQFAQTVIRGYIHKYNDPPVRMAPEVLLVINPVAMGLCCLKQGCACCFNMFPDSKSLCRSCNRNRCLGYACQYIG